MMIHRVTSMGGGGGKIVVYKTEFHTVINCCIFILAFALCCEGISHVYVINRC